ncbi:hypothetical protein G3I64_24285 [Streptomyces sp. SID8499]|nr:hypothetical protein [Streptomyces sp. SID8499]
MNDPSLPRPPDGSPRRRLCLAADVEQYSRLDTRIQAAVQTDLVRMLDEAASLSGLNRSAWSRQPQGDLEFAVLPEATPETSVLGSFVHHLGIRLRDHNVRPSVPRIRLRLAMDTGVVAAAALGHAGPAPVAVARYVNALQLRTVLAAHPTADLAVIVSDRLYQDVVKSGGPDLDPAQYVRVHVRAKEFGGYGWIRVPGHTPDEVRSSLTEVHERRPSREDCVPTRASLSQYVRQGAAVGRDVTGGLTVGLPVSPRPTGPGSVR